MKIHIMVIGKTGGHARYLAERFFAPILLGVPRDLSNSHVIETPFLRIDLHSKHNIKSLAGVKVDRIFVDRHVPEDHIELLLDMIYDKEHIIRFDADQF